jgi:hypothetical protein
MRDSDIRTALRSVLRARHADDPSTRIVEEMGLWAGTARIDMAVVNGELAGFEIKSDRDNLDRLAGQAALYNRVFDRVDLVVGARHLATARRRVPRWWGILLATPSGGAVVLEQVRRAERNPTPEPAVAAALLWRDEALSILAEHGRLAGLRGKPVAALQRALVETLNPGVLFREVREALKRRRPSGQPVGDE